MTELSPLDKCCCFVGSMCLIMWLAHFFVGG